MLTTEGTERKTRAEAPREKNDLLDVLRTLFRWKREILLTCVIAGAGTVIITLLLPVYYRATTSFLAISPDQATPELLFGTGTIAPELYGNANDLDRLLSLAESNALVDHLVDSFHLYAHYDIDTTNRKAPYNVRRKFFSLYEVTKTKRDAVELALEDQDPEMAAAMVRAAQQYVDGMAQRLIKESQLKTIQTFQDNIHNKEQQLIVVTDSLSAIRRRFGVYNTESQSETLTAELASAQIKLSGARARLEAYRNSSLRGARDSISKLQVTISGLEQETEALGEQLERFNAGSSQVGTFALQYVDANQSLSEDKERLKQYEATYQANLPAILLLEEAQVPLVKSRPKRAFIVLGAVFAAFLFSVIGVLLMENTRDINWREIYHGR